MIKSIFNKMYLKHFSSEVFQALLSILQLDSIYECLFITGNALPITLVYKGLVVIQTTATQVSTPLDGPSSQRSGS